MPFKKENANVQKYAPPISVFTLVQLKITNGESLTFSLSSDMIEFHQLNRVREETDLLIVSIKANFGDDI